MPRSGPGKGLSLPCLSRNLDRRLWVSRRRSLGDRRRLGPRLAAQSSRRGGPGSLRALRCGDPEGLPVGARQTSQAEGAVVFSEKHHFSCRLFGLPAHILVGRSAVMDDLIQRWVAGDSAAAEELYREYFGRVRE